MCRTSTKVSCHETKHRMTGRMITVRRYLANILSGFLPPTKFYRLKSLLWRRAGVAVACDARLVSSVRIWTSGPVTIGSDSFVGHDVLIVGGQAAIRIGARCDIAPRTLLVTGSHLDGGEARAAGPGVSNPIVLGDGVWIGANVTILGGVEIGEGAMIAAGSLVNKSIPMQVIAGGVPCRVIRERIVTPSSDTHVL